MELVKSTELSYKEGGSDKVYNIFLKKGTTGYVVEFAYGRAGNALTTGTKTIEQVPEEVAVKIFNKLVNEKKSKDYKENGTSDITVGDITDNRDTGLRPQLLNEIEEIEVEKYITDDNWCMQEKFDGRRRMIANTPDGIVTTNRKGLTVTAHGGIIKRFEEITEFMSNTLVIDGEDMGDKVMIFDLLSSKDTYKKRYQMLQDYLEDDNTLDVVYTAWKTTDKRKFYDHCKKSNAEGVVFKNINSKHTPGRPNSGGDQLKFKFCSTASCIVISHNTKGKRSVSIGVYDENVLIPVGNVTVYPNQRIPKEGSIIEVKYLYYFPGGSLFQPVLIMERDDLDYVDCKLKNLKAKRPIEE